MRRVRRRGGNKEKVFGCDLLEHLNASSQEIPQVLRCCSEFVERHGVVDGIYRLSGVSSNIQKLRGEFESDGNPELNKDLYLQDIHCVSSLCKAYFRELPNPLLTYQLYDKFAEAVAIQLEEERLVKIGDVLKELPAAHYRTLEFLMRHLVKMASYSPETNMHSRNLAIVWAPNLLRSKDIEATGFNGTAAFMEVRVQSIVVEFILTHVPQLFPELGESGERTKSLPSPSAASKQDETFLKSVPTQPVANYGNISPGDGPLAIRSYHAIIEGTDKRKGSLKGRKWMSIFNIGGRFPDPRRRHKHSAKEKDRPALRPARSMDSLSIQSYPNEGSRQAPAQTPPTANMSPLASPSLQPRSDAAVSAGGIGGSEYAVTYRRGTGLVSGGTQGTYTSLDPEGLGGKGNETVQSRSPGLSSKAGRRAAMHITGPTMVTVPLHITSNLALGLLQGGGSGRVVHRGRDKDGGDKVEGKEGEGKVEWKESKEMKRKVQGGKRVREEDTDREEGVDVDENTVVAGGGGGGKEKGEGVKWEKEEKVKGDCRRKPERATGGREESREQRDKRLISNTDDEEAANNDQQDDYIVMKGVEPVPPPPPAAATESGDVCAFDASDILNYTEVEGDDQELFGYVQDNFEFLDHMDCSVSYQVNEFSVEPPGHSDDEYEVMVQAQDPAELQTPPQPVAGTQTPSLTGLKPHRPLSLDLHSRHTKSLSLPYMTSPVRGPEESSSEEEDVGDDSDHDDDDDDDDGDYVYSSDEDGGMLVKSLPADFFLDNMTTFDLDTETPDSHTPDELAAEEEKSSVERDVATAGDQERGEVLDEEDEEEKQVKKKEEEDTCDKQEDQPDKQIQSIAAEEDVDIVEDARRDEEKPLAASCCEEFPPPSNKKTDELGAVEVEEEEEEEEEEEGVDNPLTDYPPCHTEFFATPETGDVLVEESREHPRTCDGEDTKERHNEEGEDSGTETTSQEMVLEMKESDESVLEEHAVEGDADKKDEEKIATVCGGEIWEELQDVVCEVIEDEESERVEVEVDVDEDGEGEKQRTTVSGGRVDVEEGGTNKTEVGKEAEGCSKETTEETLTGPEKLQEFQEKEKLQEAIQVKHAVGEEAQHHDRKLVTEEPEKEKDDKESDGEKLRTRPNVDKHQEEATSHGQQLKSENSDISQGGVGRKLVISKHPKVYQARAVPVVPPKPQHCKITALSLRQQQQQRERRGGGGGGGGDNAMKVTTEQDKVCEAAQGRDGAGERERRREGEDGATSRNSPLSMCFDEAVAIATMRREKERECGKERQRDWGSEVH